MRILLPGLILILAHTSIHAQDIDHVLSEIERNNIGLKAMKSEINAAYLNTRSENTLEAPSVEYSPFFRKGESGIASSELVVSQEFDFPTLYAARSKSANLQRNELTASQSVARRDLLLEAKKKCLALILLNRQYDVLNERAGVADELERLFIRRLDEGDANILEVNRVKIENMELKAALAENRSNAGRTISELVALNANQPLDISALTYPEVPMSLVAGDSAWLIDNDASIHLANASIESARQEIKVSRQGWLPKISLGYRRNTELKESSNGFLVGVALPIYSTSSKVKAAKEKMVASQLYMDNARANVENQVSANIAELKSLNMIIGHYDLALMKKTLELMKKSVELGNMSVIDYYIEADKIHQKIQDYFELENRYQILAAELLKNEM